MNEPFRPEDVSPQSALGPSCLCLRHLRDALSDKPVKDVVNFEKLVFSSTYLPDLMWALHTATNLSALDVKARPVTSGGVLRRDSWCHLLSRVWATSSWRATSSSEARLVWQSLAKCGGHGGLCHAHNPKYLRCEQEDSAEKRAYIHFTGAWIKDVMAP